MILIAQQIFVGLVGHVGPVRPTNPGPIASRITWGCLRITVALLESDIKGMTSFIEGILGKHRRVASRDGWLCGEIELENKKGVENGT